MAFQENDELLEQYKRENTQLRERNLDLNSGISGSNFNQQRNPDNIRYQLDTQELLQSIERFLRGDEISIDHEGNEVYIKQKNQELILFNEYGVNLIMSVIGQYINRSTFLSFYTEERINEILADIGDELSDVVFCNYEKMGLNNQFKKSRYKIIVLSILHMIESSYRRAIGGKEREEINSSRIYMPGQNNQNLGVTIPKKKFNLFNAKTW